LRPDDAPRQIHVSRTKRRAGSLSASALSTSALSTSALAVPAFPVPASQIIALIVAAGLLVAAIPAAYGQDATPAAGQSANPSSPAPGSGGPNKGAQAPTASADVSNGPPAAGGSSAQAGANAPAETAAQATADAQAAPGAQATAGAQANGAGKSGKPDAVCFKLTGRCVDRSKAPVAKTGTASASKDGASAQRPLNLTAPDVRTVVSADELKEPLPSTEQITETQEADTVSVKGEGVPADVPVGFGAIWWALNHPSQAWRIVTPYE
jgi:hypothetical protein